MTVINPNSISGITSITLPSGDGNVLTIHTNDGTERFRIDSSGNVKVGSACTISQDGDVFFTGVTTATTFTGSGANLTNLPAANLSGTLPAISAANLTNVPAANITGTLPAISAANLTNVPAANITGTLPAITAANLTNIPAANIVGVATAGLTKTGGFGKFIQFQYAHADSGDHSSANSGGNGTDVPGMSTSITLTSSSNKVLVFLSLNPYLGGTSTVRYALKLFRDSTMVFEETYVAFRENAPKAFRSNVIYLDNPADTSAHTYKVALKKESGSDTIYLFNEGANAHTITLLEVDPS